MLPRRHRLTKEFFKKPLFKKTKTDTPFLWVYVFKTPGENAYSFSVPKTATKSSVLRNKIKRRARAVVFKTLPRLNKNLSVMFFFKKGSELMSFKELEKNILDILRKSKAL